MKPEIQLYIDSLPEIAQKRVLDIRTYILDKYPIFEEKIAYGIVSFYQDKKRIYVGGFAKHISIFPGTQDIESHQEELSIYKTSKGTIQISNTMDIPYSLIDDIINHLFS